MADIVKQGAAAPATPLKSFNQLLRSERMQDYLRDVLGAKKDQFVTSLVSVVANNEALQAVDPSSIIFTAVKATALDLPIEAGLGYAALIPFRDGKSGRNVAQFQVMRNGWVELAQRTGVVQVIVNEVVHEGELVRANKFTGTYEFDESRRKSDKVVGYMAYVRLTNGFEKTVYWPVEECKAHALRYSQTYKKGYGLWKDNFDAMALKTVLKHLITKYIPKTPVMMQAIRVDQSTTLGPDTAEAPAAVVYADSSFDEGAQQAAPSGDLAAKAQAKAQEVKAMAEKAAAARGKARQAGEEAAGEAAEAPEEDGGLDIPMFR